MNRKLLFFLSVLLVLMIPASFADGFLPPLNELFDTEMPSMENALQQEADQKETLPDGSVRMVFLNCGRNEYNACSEYLGTSGCQVVNTTREGKAITAVLEKEGRKFTFSYDAGQETVTVVYPPRTFAEVFVFNFQAGDIVTFGSYPQTAEGNDHTPIEWIVLDKNDQTMLLLSRYGLDTKMYNTNYYTSITWENCTLRTWLNGEFMSSAFSPIEQDAILTTAVDNSRSQGYGKWNTDGGNNTRDKIFLLSYAEANKYLGVTWEDSNNMKSRTSPTAYALQAGARTSDSYKTADGTAAGWWWLRSPGSLQIYAAYVSNGGALFYSTVNFDSGCVRPALWINMKFVQIKEQVLPDQPQEPIESAAESEPDTQKPEETVETAETVADRTGQYLSFGTYPQTASGTDHTPIEWLVLAQEGNRLLLLSRDGLALKPYHNQSAVTSWEKSDIRSWLNGEFLKQAFTEKERKSILTTAVDNSQSQDYSKWVKKSGNVTMDQIFLLSYAEANLYLNVRYQDKTSAKEQPSPAASAEKAGKPVSWWLRSNVGYWNAAAGVGASGALESFEVSSDSVAVRPAMWITMDPEKPRTQINIKKEKNNGKNQRLDQV